MSNNPDRRLDAVFSAVLGPLWLSIMQDREPAELSGMTVDLRDQKRVKATDQPKLDPSFQNRLTNAITS